mgnify:CR=1 FL=1
MKIKTLLAIAVACFCSWQGAWADRVAPELPAAQTLESGTSYYLYNVVEQKFLCRSTTDYQYAAIGTYGDKVTITATGNESEYTIQWANGNCYFWEAYGTNIYGYSSSYTDNTGYFTIAESSEGYTIQRSPRNTGYYKADEFVGFDGSNGDRLTAALTEGSIHWQLMSVDDAEHYFAKHKLYTYLEQADQYNFYVTQYEAVYNNAASTTAQLNEAQQTLKAALDLSQNYVSPSWAEYPILFQSSSWGKNNSTGFSWSKYSTGTEQIASLTATVNVDNDATLAYTYYASSWNITLRVYLDGELVQTISSNKSNYLWTSYGSSDSDRRYYIELTPGKHDIAWTCVCNGSQNSSNSCYLIDIGVQNTPTITPATTTVEGQLGTEVLKLTDPVSSVKKIVISGVIGADDWTTIGLMVNAFSIDMSQATATAPLPASMFTKSKFPFLHYFTLPQGLTEIGESAFSGSDIENAITFPATLTSIGSGAFSQTKITAAYMPEGITQIGSSAFSNCRFLENVTYPATAGTVPGRCFMRCLNLRTFTIPEGITEISGFAFYSCWSFNPRFPQSVQTIGSNAFDNTATDSLFVTDGMTVDNEAFGNCGNLVYAEWPSTYANAGSNGIVKSCAKLNKVMLKSPTVLKYSSQNFLSGNTLGNITLLVPDFLESAYKLDPYWYQCNVQSFNSADITDWQVSQPLTLNPGQRIGGTPNLSFWGSSNFTVLGDDVQNIGDMWVEFIPFQFRYSNNSGTNYTKYQHYNFMLSNTNNVNITGKLSENIYTSGKKWYFLTLPFDTKVSDIVAVDFLTGAATSFAARYYDGASRATGATSGNWKNYAKDNIIPAGTGFIYQTAKAARSSFVAQDNSSKQYLLSNNEFVKSLDANASDVTANKGWNLVGNPWQTYYNIHKLNFTAPITVWDFSSSKYVAYSIIDDDYAIKPLEAIFVQCPDELNEISFPIDGRQLTSVIESQNGARAQDNSRKLVDVELTDGELTDKTRFVLNPQASLDYETTCDASKFFSMDASVPQLYTLELGQAMAINERPLADGTVQLGIRVAQDGAYTISAPRCQFDHITLVDLLTGTETNLASESYHFTANSGTDNARFVLRVDGSSLNGVECVAMPSQQATPVFNLNGQRIQQPRKGLFIQGHKKIIR